MLCGLAFLGLIAGRAVESQAQSVPASDGTRENKISADEPSSSPGAEAELPNPTLAYVGSTPITLADVCSQLGMSVTQAKRELRLPDAIRDRAVHLIGLQWQALQTLRRMQQNATDAEIDRWLSENLPSGEPSPTALEPLDRKRELADFRLSWSAYLAKHLTEKNVQRHFEQQPARFDGSRFVIELVSLRVPPGGSSKREAARTTLEQYLKDVAAGAESAEVSQQLPGAERLQQTVRGSGDVDPAVVSQLLKLAPGDWSEPFDTAIAVHVVRLVEVQSGALALEQVAGEVRAHMLVFLLEHLASQSANQLPLQQNP